MSGVSTPLPFDHPAWVMTHLSAHVQEQLIGVLAPLGIHPRQFALLKRVFVHAGLDHALHPGLPAADTAPAAHG